MRLAIQAVLALSTSPKGFTAGEMAATVQQLGGPSANAYTSRQAAYDIKKLKGCLAEALQLLFRKYNVAVTVSEE
jgi:predicted Zn-dependent peptidase